MISIPISISIISLLILIGLVSINKSEHQIINYNDLNKYINHKNIKRKSINKNVNYNNQNTNLLKNINNKQKIKQQKYYYKKLQNINISHKIQAISKQKHKIYTQINKKQQLIKLINISKTIEKSITKNNIFFRAINNECIIETVAKSYAKAILTNENFNVFENFKQLCTLTKVYKKEAEVLNCLIIKELILLYIDLNSYIENLKKKILKGKKVKKLKNKSNHYIIYGIYLFNPKATKLLFDKKQALINSTNLILEELEYIDKNQNILYKYILFLHTKAK